MTTRRGKFYARHANNLRQFLRFGVVGGSGVLVNMIVAVIMHKLHGGTKNAQAIIWDLPGVKYNVRFTILVWVIAFFVANLTNFQLNRTWTFKSGKHARWWSEFWPFLVVGSVAAFVGIFIKVALTNPESPLYLSWGFFHEETGLRSREYWSQLMTIVLTMPINFVVNKLWTFRAVRSHRLAEAEGGSRPLDEDEEELPLVAPVMAPDEVSEDGEVLEPGPHG